MKIEPVIVVDSREQSPLAFRALKTVRGCLATGDYSICGLEHLVSVERKSLPDLLGCIGSERERFLKELQRLRGYPYRAMVIEASDADIERADWRSSLTPAHVYGSLAAFTARFTLPIWLAGDANGAARFTERFLAQAAKYIAMDNQAAQAFIDAVAGSELAEVAA